MAKQVITRRASDNRYLHKDFHGALSVGLEYLEEHYGEEAVREYLRQFTRSYYAPLTEKLRQEGLAALEEHFLRLYRTEGAEPRISRTEDELFVEIDACPAVMHMREHHYPICRLFYETTKTVNEALCEGTPFAAELIEYDDATGRSVQRFYRRPL
jgi:predicted ArsR family transcriptional regulator